MLNIIKDLGSEELRSSEIQLYGHWWEATKNKMIATGICLKTLYQTAYTNSLLHFVKNRDNTEIISNRAF